MDKSVLIAVLASGGLWSVILKLVDYWITGKNKNSAERKAMGALLRHDMYQIYDKWKEEPRVPKDIQEEMDSLYEAYHGLGYNNMGTKIHDEIMHKVTEV